MTPDITISACCCGETALPCWCSAVGSNENEPRECKWQPLTLTLLGNMFWLISWVVAPLVVTEVRELWWPLQEAFWQFLTFQLARRCDHHSNGLPGTAVLWRNKTDLDQVSDIYIYIFICQIYKSIQPGHWCDVLKPRECILPQTSLSHCHEMLCKKEIHQKARSTFGWLVNIKGCIKGFGLLQSYKSWLLQFDRPFYPLTGNNWVIGIHLWIASGALEQPGTPTRP